MIYTRHNRKGLNNMTFDLEGIFPATVTPMNADAELDIRQLDSYIDWLLTFDGLKGVAVNMDTGEGPHLTDGERATIVQRFKSRVKGRFPVFAGLSARYNREAADQAAMYREAGADGLVVFPIPVYSGTNLDPRIPFDYHKTIADASGLPIILFQLQKDLAGVIFDEPTLRQLAAIPEVIALKEASFDAVTFVETAAIMSRLDRKITLLTGNDNFIYESLVLGARGALIGFGTIAIAEQIEMCAATLSGDFARGSALWQRIRPLEEAIFARPVRDYRARMKASLVMLGVIKNSVMRQPLLEITDPAEKEILRAALQQAGLL